MRDIELYRYLLGIASPWTVTQVELSVPKQRVDVWAGHEDTARWTCPECATELAVYGHAEERVWRHLDSCQFQTYLHARPPREQGPTHGVRQVRLAWAEPRSRFTTLFERLAIDVLRESDISGATAILRISWDEAWYLLERAVARGQARKERRLPWRIGVDEKALAKGHRYLTLRCDLETPTIEYVAEDRKQASLEAYFTQFTEAERAALMAVALDMWAPYEQALRPRCRRPRPRWGSIGVTS